MTRCETHTCALLFHTPLLICTLTGTPPLGPNVNFISPIIATDPWGGMRSSIPPAGVVVCVCGMGWLVNVKFLNMVARARRASSRAKFCPTHLRTPAPKGV
eukprot:GDKI01033970.1.p1 GENE.GDKI01033970.1~~GDKI01033970.1.p1  ORF type:complete len:101 (-),score=17.75 GDKI01033970.1:259-561(-)